ncbi:hypothetical protein Pelo_9125 [Pelomyxa schiedti]|nr:hypothetical protein Pelo_9125 [Pelomyxa schiedti]
MEASLCVEDSAVPKRVQCEDGVCCSPKQVKGDQLQTAAEELRIRGLITANQEGEDWRPTRFFDLVARRAKIALDRIGAQREKREKENPKAYIPQKSQRQQDRNQASELQPHNRIEMVKPLRLQNHMLSEDGGAYVLLFSLEDGQCVSWRVTKSELAELQAPQASGTAESILAEVSSDREIALDGTIHHEEASPPLVPVEVSTPSSIKRTQREAVAASKALLLTIPTCNNKQHHNSRTPKRPRVSFNQTHERDPSPDSEGAVTHGS